MTFGGLEALKGERNQRHHAACGDNRLARKLNPVDELTVVAAFDRYTEPTVCSMRLPA